MPQPPNLNKMLEQAQQMLAQQQEAQEKLKDERVETTAGGGMVKVVMTGDMRLESLTIAWPEASGFFTRKAEDPASKETIVRAIRAVTGTSLRLAFELRDDAALAAGPAAPQLTEEELVNRFVEEFDAEVLPSEEESP